MEKIHYLLFPVGYLFLSFIPTCLGMNTINNITTDQYALLALKNQITSETSQIMSRNWTVTSSVCEWIGVTCSSRHQRVTALNVSYMGFSGTIPPQLGNLSFLVSLDLSGNNFHGELPNELSVLRRLRVVNFRINNLRGEIPSWFGFLHELQFLSLINNSFTGSIPTSVSNLSKLELLSLSFNSLQGSIPKGIGNLHNLKTLMIESNQISGSVPHEIFNISSLEIIILQDNRLSGSLPIFMCSHLQKLKWLSLSTNKLNGQIPSRMSKCSALQVLSLSINEFDGFIPKEIGSLKELKELYLGDNNLKGEIPPEIGNLTMLWMLSIRNSKLAGAVPREFGNLYNLEELFLQNNNGLSGSIPVEIFNLSTIRLIFLSANNFSGNLPSNMCGNLPNLEHLYLHTNNLHGALPESISNCSKLNEIELATNKFVGSIPNSLGNLGLLIWLNLAHNYFTSYSSSLELGIITFLTNCKYLKVLQLQNNPLNGHLPDSVGNLSTSLERFFAYNCNINGKIPQGFGNLSSLFVLSLKENQLTGSIPETFKDLQQLQALGLNNNKLNRAMLYKFCAMQRLGFLSLSQNQILESIPECLGNVSSLKYLYLDSNRLTSSIPANLLNLKDLLELNLSSNSLSGFLPPEVGNLKVALRLDLSVNNLSGGIPSTIGGLQMLKYLSLAFNRIQESIPESMSRMISLEKLDLSHNNLSGKIPMTLETLQYLKYFNVSFNSLSGEIPSRGPFESLTGESFAFNKALCGDQRFNVPPCPKTSSRRTKSKRMLKILFILLGLGAVVGVIVCAFICFGCLSKGRNLVPSRIDSSSAAMHERFTHYKLAHATDGFSESNLLGKGGFGAVFKGTMDDGSIVAIKVFNPEVQGAFKSFGRECEVLRNLRHRNLTKVISNCSTSDFKALVLEFMPNGSLEKWLYSHNYCLDIMQRLDIVIDVACALEYLHNGYTSPVVHCDLKPSNILLDQDMVAHVSDFGISKMLDKEDSVTYTKTIATFGYVAPEYGSEGLVSPKCDVYSYGIVMMELFTRTKPSNEMFGGNLNLRSWISNAMPSALAQVIDVNALSTDDEYFTQKMECIYSIMEVALNCTKDSPRERSSIQDVLAALKKIKLQLLKLHHKET